MFLDYINIYGIIIMVLMMVPNIIFAIKNKDAQNKCTNKAMNIFEQIGRYGTFALMIVNLGAENDRFLFNGAKLIFIIGCAVLLLFYWIGWVFYFKKVSKTVMLLLAIFPSMIFVLSGVLREYWLLLIFAIIFTVSHIYVTYKNAE